MTATSSTTVEINQIVRRRKRRRGGGGGAQPSGPGGTLGSVVKSLVVNLVQMLAAGLAVVGFGRGFQTKTPVAVPGAAVTQNPERGWRRLRSLFLLLFLLSVIGAIMAAAIGVTV